MSTIVCTFWGRLDQGKGADILLQTLPQFCDQPKQHDREFHIFGNGSYYDQLVTASQTHPQIKLYGRSARDKIKPVAQAGHYCLCPSTFLETFGMTALEGCKLGLPIIGPMNGGLEQFVIEDIGGLWQAGGNTLEANEGLYLQLSSIDIHHDQYYDAWKSQTLTIASQFGPQLRLQKINKLLK